MEREREYIERLAADDLSAFDALFLHFYPKVRIFISRLIKEDEDARDLAQDVFLKIWNNRKSLPEVKLFSTYLFQMSKNAVFDYYKKTVVFDNDHAAYCFYPDDLQLEEMIEARDLELLAETFIETMPPQQKKIFHMSRKEGLTNEEISVRLNISKRTVETHISNALKELRKFFSLVTSLFF